MVVGLDGTRGGWIGIALDDDGRFLRDFVIREIDTDFSAVAEAEIIGIDVPIGFGPDRKADVEARKQLGGRRAGSVFLVPSEVVVRKALTAKRYGAGLGVSAQLYGIAPRIVHVTDLARGDAQLRRKLREVHPEVSFQAMNGCRPLQCGKKSYGGVQERLNLLRRAKIKLDAGLSGEARALPIDDVLDAAAAAWSAWRVQLGAAFSLPWRPEKEGSLRVAIWC